MKKIMFNDRFGLTEKVLDGSKTQTRRIIPQSVIDKVDEFRVEYYNMTFDALNSEEGLKQYFFVEKNLGKLPYKVGEVVAIEDVLKEGFDGSFDFEVTGEVTKGFYLDCRNKNEKNSRCIFDLCAQNAYSMLIDSISSKGTWDSNPFVFVYDFELVK